MRTELLRSSVGVLLFMSLGVGAANAQDQPNVEAPSSQDLVEQEPANAGGPSLLLVDTDTRIESVELRFVSGSAINERDLWAEVAVRPLGPMVGIQEALDFIPGIRTPTRPIFSPLSLQKDVARIREQYIRAGFVDAAVDYEARLDTAQNRISIEFVVDQGRPLVLDSVSVRWEQDVDSPEDLDPAVDGPWPAELEEDWQDQLGRVGRARGRIYSDAERARLEIETAHWFLDRGYPWASVRSQASEIVDHAVDLELVVSPGARARVDSVVVEGQRRLSEPVIRREIPIEPGDWYDENAVAAGEAELYELELIRRALGGIERNQTRDTTVTVRYQIEEALPRTIWGRAGWRSDAGLVGEGHWTHRNFWGGARSLTGSTAVETGWIPLEAAQGWTVGASVSLRQPYFFHSRVSGTVGPFLRARDDIRDRSFLYGIEAAAIYKASALVNATLELELSRLGLSDVLELVTVQELVAGGDRDYSPSFTRNLLRLTGSYGWLDDRLDPRRGYLIEPALELGLPSVLSDVQYFRMSLETVGALPLTRRIGLFARANLGRIFPYGESDPSAPDASRDVAVGLHDAMFTVGGTADVRGWGNGMLGPKLPDVRFPDGGGVPVVPRYVPVGGLARLAGSFEVMLPFPFLSGSHNTFVFLDGGRVWTPGEHFAPPDPELAIEPWGFSTGGGVQIGTPVGPVRLSLGYKLNPSRVDLLAPGDVTRVLAAGGSIASLPTDNVRRWHLHLAIGRSL